MKEKYTIEDFLQIMERLRAKDGCPWDREQTHDSLKPCLKEETAELLASIRIYNQTGSYENMREELGDILLQVVMHSTIAKEENLFTFEDVVDEVAKKMVYRHPNVFGKEITKNSEEQLQKWEELKKKEKEGKEWVQSPLRDIPPELDTLTRATKIAKKVEQVYHEEQVMQDQMEILKQSVNQLQNAIEKNDKNRLEETVGTILQIIAFVSSKKRISPEQILSDRIAEIVEKYEPKS